MKNSMKKLKKRKKTKKRVVKKFKTSLIKE